MIDPVLVSIPDPELATFNVVPLPTVIVPLLVAAPLTVRIVGAVPNVSDFDAFTNNVEADAFAFTVTAWLISTSSPEVGMIFSSHVDAAFQSAAAMEMIVAPELLMITSVPDGNCALTAVLDPKVMPASVIAPHELADEAVFVAAEPVESFTPTPLKKRSLFSF